MADGVLAAIVRAVEALDVAAATDDLRLGSPLGRQLLQRLQTELIRLWAERGGTRTSAYDTLTAVVAIESLCRVADRTRDHLGPHPDTSDGLALMGDIANDLRSPLTSIQFLASGLQREHTGPLNELQRHQLGIIYSAALGLSDVVTNVIELARGETPLARDEFTPFSITDVLESVLDITYPMAEAKGLSLRLQPPARPNRLGHPAPLTRILLNLATNGIMCTEEGFVELAARETTLNRVEFSVRDTGRGMSPEEQRALFAPFRRVPDRNRVKFSAGGLGLALARRLLAVMDSALHVDSAPGESTRLYFELDLYPADHV